MSSALWWVATARRKEDYSELKWGVYAKEKVVRRSLSRERSYVLGIPIRIALPMVIIPAETRAFINRMRPSFFTPTEIRVITNLFPVGDPVGVSSGGLYRFQHLAGYIHI